MDGQQGDIPDRTKRDRTIFVVISIVLIANLLWRVLTPAHELPLRTEQVMTMVVDFLMVAGLVGLRSRVPTLQPLFWIALVAGVGLFAIRLTSAEAWWSGHLMYSLN